MRKAGGTTLCAVLRLNFNATPFDCFIIPSKDSWTLSPMTSLAAVATRMREQRLEAVASQDGSAPLYSRPQVANAPSGGNAGAGEHRWVFLTSMRDPIDRLVSALNYDGEDYKRKANARASDAGRPPPSLFELARDYGAPRRPKVRDCHRDNYATRVFSGTCHEERNMTRADFDEAARAVVAYDICFVTEWMAEMAPLLRYLLGAEHLDAAPRNVHGVYAPGWNKGRTDFVPALGRDRAAQRRSVSSHASRLMTPAELAELREDHAWDVQLYGVCKRSARALAKRHLFTDDNRRRLKGRAA